MGKPEVQIVVGGEVCLTSEQVAERIGVNRSRVRQLCIAGRFPGAVKMARTWFIPASGLEAYLEHPDKRRKRDRGKDKRTTAEHP